MNSKIILLVFFIMYFSSCNNEKDNIATDNNSTEPVKEFYIKKSPDFNADSAFYRVEKQVKFGARVPGTKAHAACADYLFSELKKYCKNVFINSGSVKTFDGKIFTAKNIMAQFNPENKKRILLSCHWDSRPFADQDNHDQNKPIDGANDGGSGVGTLIEVARMLKEYPASTGVDIVFFDIEDYGQPADSKFPRMEDSYCIGSQLWANDMKKKNYKAEFGINLDMTGNKNAKFAQEGTSLQFSKERVNYIWDIANKLNFYQFIYFEKDGITDDHLYVGKILEIPMTDIIEYDATTPSGFPKTWHTHEDNISNISRETLKAVGQTVAEVVYTFK